MSLTSPSDGDTLTERATITGTVDSQTLDRWLLAYRPQGDVTWTTLATGTTPVTNSPLGSFDPTLLLNGVYELQLSATDVSGRIATATIAVVIEGRQKIGAFTVSFIDLDIPVAGFPIQVIRTYDSRDKSTGDFGAGWTLTVKSLRAQETRAVGKDWEGTVSPDFFPVYCIVPTRTHIVTIVLPNDTVYKFQPTVNPECQSLTPQSFVTIDFIPLPGTNASLAPLNIGDALVVGAFGSSLELEDTNTGNPIDPTRYQLTLEDGRVLVLDRPGGLESVTDLNNNTLAITPTGIIHSSGKSIPFNRDVAGRIRQIIDPMSH